MRRASAVMQTASFAAIVAAVLVRHVAARIFAPMLCISFREGAAASGIVSPGVACVDSRPARGGKRSPLRPSSRLSGLGIYRLVFLRLCFAYRFGRAQRPVALCRLVSVLVRLIVVRICELSRWGLLPLIGAPRMSAGGAPIFCPLCPFLCPWRDFVGCLIDLYGVWVFWWFRFDLCGWPLPFVWYSPAAPGMRQSRWAAHEKSPLREI